VIVRDATEADLEHIVAITRATRHRLDEWAPDWWRMAAGADELHPLWLRHVLLADGPRLRVAADASGVVGCAASMPQADQWFVDDIGVTMDERWVDAGDALLRAVPERPALTCVPTADAARRDACERAALSCVSTYWITTLDPRPGAVEPNRGGHGAATLQLAPPRHSFGDLLDSRFPGAFVLDDGDGIVAGSGSVTPPPVYDPGGSACIVDRVAGDHARLLDRASAVAAGRGDRVLCVVCGVDDRDLAGALRGAGFRRIVAVYAWPDMEA
jgi:hypothetical protein